MKRFLKALLLIALTASLLVGAVGITAAAVSPVTKDKGLTFTDYVYKKQYPNETYQTEKKLDEVPHTFEGWVYLPSSVGDGKGGTVLGNFSAKSGGRFSFDIADNRNPSLRFSNRASGVNHTAVFDKISVECAEWVHVVIVWDEALSEFRCYINGELGQTVKADSLCGDDCAEGCEGIFSLYSAGHYNLCLGGDLSYLCENFFRGGLQDVAMYSDVLSEAEIKNSYKNGVNVENEGLILYYDIDSLDKNTDIEDLSGNGYHMYFSKTWMTEAEMQKVREEKGFAGEYAYSLAVIGDPQYATRLTPSTVETMYQWVVDNKDEKNIQYVIGLGDITDNCTAEEWERAFKAFKIFEEGNLEFSFIRGNHDVGNGGDKNAVIAPEKYDELMGSFDFYTNQFDNYGGYYKEGSVVNTYRTITLGGDDWLMINLDWQPKEDVLAWACEVVEAHPNHRTMIVTHENVSASGYTSTYGTKLWNGLTSKYENIELVLSGHVSWDNIMVYQSAGVHGNTVTQILIDPQRIDLILGGQGIVAMFYFREDGSVIDIEYYSVIKDRYFKNRNQLTVDLGADGRQFVKKWDGVTSIEPQGSGTESDPYRIYDGSNLLWMSEQLTAYGESGAVAAPTELINVFKDKYFVQMQTIDLHGYTIPSIGYYFESDSVGSVFAGHYDGQGYAIYNGRIENPLKDSGGEHAATGLFGAVWGATVENVTLRNISVNASADSGILVGRAASPEGVLGFNKISGCHIESTCALTLSTGENAARVCAVGSIVGKASGISITDCRSDATLDVRGVKSYVGGIAGDAGISVLIQDCVSNCNIKLVTDSSYAAGGILGAITDSASVTVASCVSNVDISAVCTKTEGMYLGGILGISKDLAKGSANLIVNCNSNGNIKVTGTKESVYIGGMIGYAIRTADSAPLFASGCKNGMDLCDFNSPDGSAAVVGSGISFTKKDADTHTVSCGDTSCTAVHVYNSAGYCKLCEADITGAQVVIGKDLALKVFAEVYDTTLLEGKKVLMEILLGEKAVTLEGVLENGEYVFKLEGISPEQIGEIVDMALLSVEGENSTVIAKRTGYSIKKYCESILAKNPDNKTLRDVVSDLLTYGAGAQTYKKHNTHSFVTAGVDITPTTKLPLDEAAEEISGNEDSNCRIGVRTASFEDGPSLSIKLRIVDLSLAKIKINGKNYDLTSLESSGGSNYILNISDIFVSEYTEQSTVELYYNGELCSTLTFSMASYMADEIRKSSSINPELADYLLAAYRLSYSAKAYLEPAA